MPTHEFFILYHVFRQLDDESTLRFFVLHLSVRFISYREHFVLGEVLRVYYCITFNKAAYSGTMYIMLDFS